MTDWKVAFGTRKGGPFDRDKLKQLVRTEKVPLDGFVRANDDSTDWQQVATAEWLYESAEPAVVRYCLECDSRLLVSPDASGKKTRCPNCAAVGTPVDYLDDARPVVDGVPPEPWGKYGGFVAAFSGLAILAGLVALGAMLFNPWLTVLLGFILVASGAGLYGLSWDHRNSSSKYRTHLRAVELSLTDRTDALRASETELRGLKRNLRNVREEMIRTTEEELQQKRSQVAEELAAAQDSVNAVHRMAERFLDETRKWWTTKLNVENFQTTKERITKAVAFCRKQGYPVSTKQERELNAQLKMDYEAVVRREHEKNEQKRIREQMREEQRVEREIKRELERIDTEKRAIEKALEEALQRVGADHSAEVELLREKLREAEERGQRTKAQAELTKVGNVYVISNIGSFGDNVFKVGLTRRLEPLDRVKELGDASVPFTFDVHMMIFSEDAPKLESTLHRALHKYRVNRVNFRKEFFRVDLDTIRAVVEENHGVVEYVADAEALQYRESLNISDDDFDFLAKVAETSGIEDEDDDLDGMDEV